VEALIHQHFPVAEGADLPATRQLRGARVLLRDDRGRREEDAREGDD
jgi:hypothetical protein